jgi:hypothetical protein
MTEAVASIVISYARFREHQDRRRATTVAPRQPDRPPTSAGYVVHVEAMTASLRPLNRKPY